MHLFLNTFILIFFNYSVMLLWNIILSIFMAKSNKSERHLKQERRIPVEETWDVYAALKSKTTLITEILIINTDDSKSCLSS